MWGLCPTTPLPDWTGAEWMRALQTWGQWTDPWHVLLWGDEGCGKTTTLDAMVQAWGPASPRDLVRVTRYTSDTDPPDWRAFAQSVGRGRRVLHVDDVDHLSLAHQQSLRAVLDHPGSRVCVWMTCRSPQHVLPTLRSRVLSLHLSSPSPELVHQWMIEWESRHPHVRLTPELRHRWIHHGQGNAARLAPWLERLARVARIKQVWTWEDVHTWGTEVPDEQLRRHWNAVCRQDLARALREGIRVWDDGFSVDDWIGSYDAWLRRHVPEDVWETMRGVLGDQWAAARDREGEWAHISLALIRACPASCLAEARVAAKTRPPLILPDLPDPTNASTR
jgi:hypothetical protein